MTINTVLQTMNSRYFGVFLLLLLVCFGTATADSSAPVANFFGTPTTVLVSSDVQFTDLSTNSSGWAWFFGDENWTVPAWTQMNASAGWSARTFQSTVAMPDGSIVLMGGNDGSTFKNDVWRSTDNGVTWTLQNSSAGWSPRVFHSSVAMPDGSIILMGGNDVSTLKNDVWRSTDNGVTWIQQTESAGWLPRAYHSSVAMPDGSIILMGGMETSGEESFSNTNDVWRSTDNGITWVQVNASAGWSARINPSSVAMPDGSIILTGGSCNGFNRNDVWRSTNNGITWVLMNASAGWQARSDHNSVAMPDGSIILMGGMNSTYQNDVWRSTDNGVTWTLVTSHAGWSARTSPSSVAMPDGSIVLMGGMDYDGNTNDVWRFMPAGSTEQNPSHSYSLAGTYSVALQAYNSNGCNSTRKTGYITVQGPPVTQFTANITSGRAPMAVSFTDHSTNSPTSWSWSFGDGTFSGLQNPVHTYMTEGTYTVSLNTINGYGSNSSVLTDYIVVRGPGPVPDFSANITIGTAPMAVFFTDHSLNNATGWAWYFGDEDYSQAWTQQTASAGWPERAYHSGVAMPDGSVVLMGGSNGDSVMYNDVWRSTNKGVTWTLQNASAGWPARAYHSSVAMPDGSIVLMGGLSPDPDISYNDVWRSTDNGTTWVQQTENADWSARHYQNSVAMPDGSIILIGGVGNSGINNDVWRSTDNGVTWTLQNASAGWSGRYLSSSVAMPDGSIILTGGNGMYGKNNDVWRSTDNGVTWTLQTAKAAWPARSVHGIVAMPDGSILIMGGYSDSGDNNDVWRSTDNGVTWTQITAGAAWSERHLPSTVVMEDSSILLIGGTDCYGRKKNDVWRLMPAGSTEQNPSHYYSLTGNYSVALQAYSSNGCNSTLKTGYINAQGPPVAHFSVNITSGKAPLPVSFTDHSINSPTSWNWSFGDGNFSGLQNPVHIYTVEGRYNVSLDAINAFGSNVSVLANPIVVHGPSPVSDFSANVTSGTAPLAVSFTDHSLNSPTGWAWYFGDEDYTQAWTRQTADPGWPTRHTQSSVAMPDGTIVVSGGTDTILGDIRSDVWQSADNGVTWTQQTAEAGWSPRTGHSSVAMADGSIILMGGYGDSGKKNDVWRSTDNGATWTLQTANAGWSPRTDHSSVAMPDGSIVLTGGYEEGMVKNDVWRSTDNGATWTLQTANAGWSQRTGHSSVAMPDGSIILTGGYDVTSAIYNDVWRSTDNGATWTRRSASAGWSPRFCHGTVAMPDGSVLLTGGYDGNSAIYNDVWRSTDNGATWTRKSASAGWPPRACHGSVLMPDGSVVLIGGFGNEANNVWRFMPAGSTAQNSSHTYTLPGNYSVVLQAYSYNGCNSTLKTGYITVRGLVPPEADFTGIPVNGTAPLLVQFNDTSTVTGITAYTWIFSDDPGSVYTTQNLSHTFNTTGTYDVSHSVTNSTGTTFWKNVTSYITVESSGTVAPAKIGLFRGGFWILDYNGNYQWSDVGTGNDLVAGFGMAGDKPVIGNWNHTIPGDKIGVFRNGTWLMDYNGNFQWDGVDKSAYLGQAGDIPVIGDWNNNGDKKIGVFRNGFWMLDGNGNYTWDGTGTGLDVVAGFGQTGDIPVVGDWNGNHQDKIGLFRNGFWILDYNGNYVWNGPGTGNDLVAGFGAAGDIPIVKDWDGDGISEIAVFRPSAGQWLIDYNGNYLWDGEGAGQDVSMYLGQNGDVAIAGDWNSNGNDKLGVFRDGFWIIDTDGDFIWDGPPDDKVAGFGQAGDIPVPGKYV